MSVYQVRVHVPTKDANIIATVRADSIPEAIKKLLDTTPGLTDFYRIDIQEQFNGIIVE